MSQGSFAPAQPAQVTPTQRKALLRAWVSYTHGLNSNPPCRRGFASWSTERQRAEEGVSERASDVLLIAHVDNTAVLGKMQFPASVKSTDARKQLAIRAFGRDLRSL